MEPIDFSSAVALVTGANRGFGRQLAEQLARRGAKVYAAARRPETVDLAGVIPLHLDLTDPKSIALAADQAPDVTLLVNNAGTATGGDLFGEDLAGIRADFETHVFGTLEAVRAFVPIIEGNGGGAILNVLSVLSWFTVPHLAGYSAAKSAEWSITNALRAALASRNIRVSGLHVGYMDTDLTAALDVAKQDPAAIAALALDQLASGAPEILADDLSKQVQAGLAGGVAALYPAVA